MHLGLSASPIYGYIWNIQAWQLAHGYCNCDGKSLNLFKLQDIIELATDHLEKFSFVGTLESFQQGRDTVLRDLGIPLPKVNIVENAALERTTTAYLTNEARDLLQELTVADQVIYDLVVARQKA